MSLGRETHAISDSAAMLAPNPSRRKRDLEMKGSYTETLIA
jgi:hypothetical protein